MSRRRRRAFVRRTWADPSDFSEILFWLRSDLGVTLNDDQVSQWADQSGQGNHFAQATEEDQPYIDATGLNGVQTIDFRASEFLWTAAYDSLSDRVETPAAANGYVAFIAVADAETSGDNGFCIARDSVNAGSFRFDLDGDSWKAVIRTNINQTVDLPTASDAGTYYLLEYILTAGTGRLYVNGTEVGTGTTGVVAWDLDSTSARFVVGAKTDIGNLTAGSEMDGKIAEVVCALAPPSAASRAAFHAYVEAQWGLDIA